MKDEETLVFGGFGPLAPEIAKFTKPRRRSAVDEAYSRLASTAEGKRLYGNPETGATLEQAWRFNWAWTGARSVCLLVSGKSTSSTVVINRVVKMNPQQLVDTLGEMLERYKYPASVFYHDGHTRHAIAICKYESETSRFAYIDSWPGDSLLSKKFNAAGVDAQPKDYLSLGLPDIKRTYWTITAKELELVIVAAFVFPSAWSEYLGEKYCITFDEFQNTDFWSRFQIREENTGKTPKNNVVIYLQSGVFKSEINLLVTVDQKRRVIQGILTLNRDWVINPSYEPYGLNPSALDIARSFIATLIPPADQQRMSPLIKSLKISKLVKLIDIVQNRNHTTQTPPEGLQKLALHEALSAYLGTSSAFLQASDFSDISMINVKNDEYKQLEIDIRIYAP